jgi:hypothetical protein
MLEFKAVITIMVHFTVGNLSNMTILLSLRSSLGPFYLLIAVLIVNWIYKLPFSRCVIH